MKNKIFYMIKNMFFIFFLISIIVLVPNILEMNIIGNIFLIIVISYIILELGVFTLKDKETNNNILHNILSIMLYVYICLIAYRYIDSIENINYVVNPLYFKINYILAMVGIMGICLNLVTTLLNKDEKLLAK